MDYRDCVVIAEKLYTNKFYDTDDEIKGCGNIIREIMKNLGLREGKDYEIIYGYTENSPRTCRTKYTFIIKPYTRATISWERGLVSAKVYEREMPIINVLFVYKKIKTPLTNITPIIDLIEKIYGIESKPVDIEEFNKAAHGKLKICTGKEKLLDDGRLGLYEYDAISFVPNQSRGYVRQVELYVMDKYINREELLWTRFDLNETGLNIFKSEIEYYEKLQKINSVIGV